jgi:hypothetical protein
VVLVYLKTLHPPSLKTASPCAAGKNFLDPCTVTYQNVKITDISSLMLEISCMLKKEKCNCRVNKQIHIHNTRNNKDYHKYRHNLELYNSKPSVAGCIFYNK